MSLGHRRQLLRAIAELTSREKKAPKPAVASAASAARAEHRQIFVMFLQSSELDGVLGANGP